MAKSIARYFRLLPKAQRIVADGGRMWYPPADVYRTPEGWIVKVELAGVCAEELEIEITGATLRIGGCRRDTFHNETVSYHQLEITYSRFEKLIRFPCPIEGAEIESDYNDGLLILSLRGRENCD
jgi:HSP20 family protein